MLKRLLSAAALSVAVTAGAAVPASAVPSANPLAPITTAVSSASGSGSAASATLPVDTLVAARAAGLPIYEAGEVVVTYASKMGAYYATEYRRVYDVDALNSPAAKFITFGASAPDHFHVTDGGEVVVNMRPIEPPQIFSRLTYDMTPQTWLNSPPIQLQEGGPGVGIAFVR